MNSWPIEAVGIPGIRIKTIRLLIRLEDSLFHMSKEEMKGRGKRTKGEVREVVGKMTNNKTEQLKGRIEQAEGKAREQIGKAARKNKNK
jgi:uncharacterized protein YjbJ (UPF0337 family)